MSQRLRIAMIVGTFPAVSETFILRQVTGLIDLGHEVDIFSELRGETGSGLHAEIEKYRLLERTTFMDMPPEVFPGELSVWPLNGETWPPGAETAIQNSDRLLKAAPKMFRCRKKNPDLTRRVLSSNSFGYQADSLSALYRLDRMMQCTKFYDVAHAHFGPVGNSFRFLRELWRTPLIVTFHGYDFSSAPREGGSRMYEKLFAVADAVTVNSRYAGSILEQLGCPPAKIFQLNVGLEIFEFTFAERTLKLGEPVRICSVGRLVEKKGYEYSLQALAKVRARGIKFRYEIIGDGPLKEKLLALALELGIADAVVFHGSQGSHDVRRILTDSHIFLLSSVVAADGDTEGTPVSLMEAQALGMPIVSTLHAGIPEIVANGVAGFLVPEKNADALAERLIYLTEHPALWPAMGHAGRQAMEANHALAKLNRDLVEIYANVLNPRTSA